MCCFYQSLSLWSITGTVDLFLFCMLTCQLHISDNTELKKLERAIFIRLDKMDQKLSTIETLLRSIAQPTDISEFFLNPCKSIEELEELCLRMKDSECKKKTVSKFNSRYPN